MGYAAEKKIVENKRKIAKRILFLVFFVLFVALIIVSAVIPVNTWKYRVKLPKTGVRADGELRIHFIDVGQGDATLIELPDGKIMLVDGGDGSDEATKALIRYLNALKIEKIHYLLVTHADDDHCGGLDEVLKFFSVSRAFLPYVKPSINNEFASFYKSVTQSGCDLQYSSRKISLSTESYTLQFLYPYTNDVQNAVENGEYFEYTNEASAVFWLDYQGVSTLFTGDAPTKILHALIDEDSLGLLSGLGVTLDSTEILKVSHHGSKGGTDGKTLDYFGVKTAVVSCGADNAYSHPHAEVMDALVSRFVDCYRTDKDGSVIITVQADGRYGVEKIA